MTADLYCGECERSFQSTANLRAHLNSKLHQTADHECPMPGCERTFIATHYVFGHWEAGACESGVTRHKVDRQLASQGYGRPITTQRVNRPEDWSYSVLPISQRCFSRLNGWSCPFEDCSKSFRYKKQLKQHLMSPRHVCSERRLYQCVDRDCGKEFVSLSGLASHVALGVCGAAKKQVWRDTVQAILNRARGMI